MNPLAVGLIVAIVLAGHPGLALLVVVCAAGYILSRET